MERLITDKIINAEGAHFRNPSLVKNMLVNAARSFDALPVDVAHNFEYHGLPTAINVLIINEYMMAKSRKEKHRPLDVNLDAVVCAAAIHDRQRTVLGHVPGDFLGRKILKSSGASGGFQDLVMSLVKSHSAIEHPEHMSIEEKILIAADKLEYLSVDRAREALSRLPKIIAQKYKRYWVLRINKVEKLMQTLVPELGIEKLYQSNLNRCKDFVNNNYPELLANGTI